MKVNENALLKISAVVCFSLISLALILIERNPSRGYELSIYTAPSPLIWVLLAGAIVGGVTIVVHQVFKKDKEGGNWWRIGLLLILLSSLIIVLLPALKGYAFSDRGDQLNHVGMARDILQSGSFSDNIYPITHSLLAEFCLISNIPLTYAIDFVGPLFYLMFVMSIYLLSREILPRQAAILATVSSTVLFAYYYIEVFPMGFAFMTFPFILFLYFRWSRQRSPAFGILLISLIALMAYFHLAAAFVLGLVLLVMELCKLLLSRKFIAKRILGEFSRRSPLQISLGLPFIAFATVTLWAWNHFEIWQSTVLNIERWFHGELLKTNMWQRSSEAFGALQLEFGNQVELFIRLYGHILIYCVLCLFVAIMLVRNKTSLSSRAKRNTLLLSFVFLLIALVALLDYERPLTMLTPGRLLWLLVALSPPLVGLALYQISGVAHQGRKTAKSLHSKILRAKPMRGLLMALILTFCSLIGVFGVYGSPFTHLPNTQVTHMESDGYAWLLDHGNQGIKVVTVMTTLSTLHDAIYGARLTTDWEDEDFIDHFNYPSSEYYGESFETDKYQCLSKYSKLLYTELWPAARFTWEDFARLEEDPSVSRLYANGEMNVYYVRSWPSAGMGHPMGPQ